MLAHGDLARHPGISPGIYSCSWGIASPIARSRLSSTSMTRRATAPSTLPLLVINNWRWSSRSSILVPSSTRKTRRSSNGKSGPAVLDQVKAGGAGAARGAGAEAVKDQVQGAGVAAAQHRARGPPPVSEATWTRRVSVAEMLKKQHPARLYIRCSCFFVPHDFGAMVFSSQGHHGVYAKGRQDAAQ